MRVVSFAFAGAKNFTPISYHGEKRGKGKPNWQGIQDIFVTLSKTFFYVALLTTLIVLLGLSFGINNLVESLTGKNILIITVVCISTIITQIYVKYNIFLLGFNEVALVNRWNTLFGIFGIIGSLVILSSGGGLIKLIAWQMLIPVISSLRDKWLFNNYLKKRKILNNGKFDKKILIAVKDPLWKGLIGHVSQMGMVQISGIILTMYGDPVIVASYLFSLRILTMLAQFSQVPFTSKNPYFSILRSENNTELLAKMFQNRILVSLILYSIGIIFILLFKDYFLLLIDSNVSFVSNEVWLLMGLLYGIERINIFFLAILASANRIVMIPEQVISTGVTLLLLFLSFQYYGIIGFIFTLWLPRIIIFNLKPLVLANNSLNLKNNKLFFTTIWSPFLLLIVYIFNHYVV